MLFSDLSNFLMKNWPMNSKYTSRICQPYTRVFCRNPTKGPLCFPRVFNCQKIGIKRDIHGWLRIDVGNAGLLSKYPNLVEATPFLAKN